MKYNVPIDFSQMVLGDTLSETGSVRILRPEYVQTPVVCAKPSGSPNLVTLSAVDAERFQIFQDTMLDYTKSVIELILVSYPKWFQAGTLDRDQLNEILYVSKYDTPEVFSGQFILVVYAKGVTFTKDHIILTYEIKNRRLITSDTCLIK